MASESMSVVCRDCGKAFQPAAPGRWVHVCTQTAKISRVSFGDSELEQELAQARALLDEIEHIIQHDCDWDAVTEWRDALLAFRAHKE